ncbi:hypothetical protein EWM64_g5973 [Hericium alpestre]|uniref:BTB domain-containing protein n=1 Tax=Hericium alpestre TaxID=135208 RepID=A0A4Y9ZT14_9AGAM|nr:hypothetical protein EWM64_g5973 [Hericium alpestre]
MGSAERESESKDAQLDADRGSKSPLNPAAQAFKPSPTSFSPRTTSEVWFPDGGIIIVCGSSGFRIHGGFLAFKSAVFKDMFAAGDADAGANETSEGCMVVRLPDDAADMVRLLDALYSPRKYFKGKAELSFDIMNSLLKLATKYRFTELRADLVELLVDMFPSDREKYTLEPPPNIAGDPYLDPIAAVEFGLTYNIPAILPAACYEVAMMGMETLFNTESLFGLHGAQPMEVSRTTLRTCTVFLHKWHAAVEEALDADNLDCEDPWVGTCPECDGFPDRQMRQAVERRYRLLDRDIFTKQNAHSSRAIVVEGLADCCESCLEGLDRFDDSVRDALWLKLPSLCGYDNWDAINEAEV